MSAELWRYLVWTSVVALGAVLAIVDRRILGRWLLGMLLVAAVAIGMLVTIVSPFRFGGTSYYMEGVILAGGSALALIGYVFTLVGLFSFRRMCRKRE